MDVEASGTCVVLLGSIRRFIGGHVLEYGEVLREAHRARFEKVWTDTKHRNGTRDRSYTVVQLEVLQQLPLGCRHEHGAIEHGICHRLRHA